MASLNNLRHPRVGGDPDFKFMRKSDSFAGMTGRVNYFASALIWSTIPAGQALEKSELEIGLLHGGAESIEVWFIDLEALGLQAFNQFVFLLQLVLAAEFGGVIGGLLQLCLIFRRQAIEHLLGNGEVVQVNKMRGQTRSASSLRRTWHP